MQPPPKKLLDQVRDAIRLKHYAYRTEETYVQWICRYILFHNKRHPKEIDKAEIEAFLTHLAVEGRFLLRHKIKPSVPCYFSIVKYSILTWQALMLFERNDLSLCQPC